MSGSIFHPFVLDNAAGQDTVVGIGSDSEKYGVGISSHVHITGIGTFSDLLHTTGVIHAVGGIKDTSGDIGNSGQVLSSTGSGLNWINPGDASVENASNIGVNLYSANADQFVAFVGASSGNNPVRVDAGIKYNPSSNLLTVGSITGSIAASNINSGTLGLDRIPSLPASKITSGQFDAARIPTLNQNTTGNAATATSATTAGTVTTAAQTNITSLGTLTGLTVNGNIIQSGMSNYIRVNGAIQDKDGQSGNSGQVLSSTGSQIDWVNVGSLAAGSAAEIAVSDESTETSCNVLFSTSASGNIAPKTGSNLTFNSSSGLLVASGFSGDGSSISSINGSNISTGTVAAARIDNLNASKINSGTFADARIPSLNASKINAGTFADARIPSLAASKITSGTLGTDRIPNLAASKITSGTLGTARIPSLAASKITSGTLGTDRIPSLAASKITSGQFDTARIPTLNQNTTGTAAGLSGSPSITVTNITIDGQLRDGDNAFGSSGQVLSSDGTDTKWINAGSLSAGAAAQVAVNATNSTNSSHFIAFTETSSGNEEIRVDNSLTYNPSTNVLTAGTFSGSGASLTNIPAGNLTGTVADARISTLTASKLTGALPAISGASLTNLPAGNLTGTVADARISTLTASKLTGALPAIDGSALTGIVSDKIFEGNSEVEVIDTGSLGLIKFVTEGDERLRIDSSGHLKLPNNAFIRLGDAQTSSGTLRIYSNGSQSYISPGITGNHIRFLNSGSTSQVELYFGTAQKLSTQSYGILVQGNVSATNNLSCNNNLLCSGTASVANTLTVTGSEGTDAILELLADDGDDNEDKWRIRSDATGNDLKFETYASGSWSDGTPLQLSSNGIVTMPGQAVIDEVNINGNVVQTNTSNELVVRGKGTGGSHHLKLDDDVTIVGDLTVQGVGGFKTGMIILWSGAQNQIPSGWVLCDGNNGTPDLRNRFIIGAGSGGNYSVGDTGGSKDATLVSHSHTINNHTHSFSGTGSNTHNHNIFSTDIDDHNDSARRIENSRNDWTGYYPSNRDISTDNATISISISGTTGNPSNTGTNSQGSSATNANLPPYYALCYIMKS